MNELIRPFIEKFETKAVTIGTGKLEVLRPIAQRKYKTRIDCKECS